MTIAEILQGLDDRRLAAVPTPEWPELDGQLFARKFCGRQRAEYYAAMRKFQASEGPQFVALVVACGTVDAQGAAAFAAEDYAWIVEKDPDALGRLFAAIDERNLLSSAAQGELIKNCEPPGNSAA